MSDDGPDATFVLVGDFDVWKDILEGYDSGKAVMYRRLRLEKGDVFRFFNRIYFFTESLVALSKVPAQLPPERPRSCRVALLGAHVGSHLLLRLGPSSSPKSSTTSVSNRSSSARVSSISRP